jgi:predicted GNAT family acetyltransferase
VKVVTHEDATSFLEATAIFRGEHPTLTSIIGSVATGIAAGRAYSDESWYAIEDGDVVVGCAMRTPPWHLAVSPMDRPAAHALADVLRTADPDLPGIVGPRDVAQTIADALGVHGKAALTEYVRVLHEYRPPTGIEGASRCATAADLDLVLRWWAAFAEDAGLPLRDADTLPGQLTAMFDEQRLHLWEVSDEPVAMGGHASLVPTPAGVVARIGPVYTPRSLRGRGFGTAITAALVEHLQSRSDLIMLFTDSGNPTSNGIYERLGFNYEDEFVELEFSPSRHDAS